MGVCSRAGSRPSWWDEDAYLLEVCRYVELNPVRVRAWWQLPGDWPWSSYRAHVGQAAGLLFY